MSAATPPVPELTYYEMGALLSAIGREMSMHGLCAGAVRDGDSDEEMIRWLKSRYDMTKDRAQDLLDHVTNEMLIDMLLPPTDS